MGKITQDTAQQIIHEFCQGGSSYELADKYGLWQTSICNLISGRTWKQCIRPENIKELISERHTKGFFQYGHTNDLHESYPELTYRQKEILTGSLLGDGFLHKTYPTHPNSYFGKKQCKRYEEYVRWHYDELMPFSKPVREVFDDEHLIAENGGLIVERQQVDQYLAGHIVRTCSHPYFTELRNKWYPEGKKIIPQDIKLTPLIIAIWFCDDGCNSFRGRQGNFHTQSFTLEEADFLCQLLKELEITARVTIKISAKTGKDQPILKCNSKSYDNLIELIKPHIVWDCMAHKIKHRDAARIGFNMAKFNEQDVLKIYELSKTHKQYEIAEMYGVHKNTISSLLRGDSWQHLSEYNPYIPKSKRRRSSAAA